MKHSYLKPSLSLLLFIALMEAFHVLLTKDAHDLLWFGTKYNMSYILLTLLLIFYLYPYARWRRIMARRSSNSILIAKHQQGWRKGMMAYLFLWILMLVYYITFEHPYAAFFWKPVPSSNITQGVCSITDENGGLSTLRGMKGVLFMPKIAIVNRDITDNLTACLEKYAYERHNAFYHRVDLSSPANTAKNLNKALKNKRTLWQDMVNMIFRPPADHVLLGHYLNEAISYLPEDTMYFIIDDFHVLNYETQINFLCMADLVFDEKYEFVFVVDDELYGLMVYLQESFQLMFPCNTYRNYLHCSMPNRCARGMLEATYERHFQRLAIS